MKPIACLLLVVLSLCAANIAIGQTGKAARVMPVLVQVLGADMSPSCKDSDVARARLLVAACDGKQQCRYTPEVGDAAAEACAADSQILWNCNDGLTRMAALAPKPGQSREIHMECAQPALAATAPAREIIPATSAAVAAPPGFEAVPVVLPPKAAPPPGTAQSAAAKQGTEVVNVQDIKSVPVMVAKPVAQSLNVSEAGIAQETLRMACEDFTDPYKTGEDPRYRLNQLHANIWAKPDHTAGSTSPGCGVKTRIPGSAIPQ